ncbi:unnamed protein product, partial [Mesorhabditis belari]|uniref:F-box domain-containing protein n=1 Tax=Mesorhabditis belari TaxID=2138241 RepID=A0AAF3FLJ9_9BILA
MISNIKNSTFTFSSLPTELKISILDCLPISERHQLLRTTKDFRSFILSKAFPKKIKFFRFVVYSFDKDQPITPNLLIQVDATTFTSASEQRKGSIIIENQNSPLFHSITSCKLFTVSFITDIVDQNKSSFEVLKFFPKFRSLSDFRIQFDHILPIQMIMEKFNPVVDRLSLLQLSGYENKHLTELIKENWLNVKKIHFANVPYQICYDTLARSRVDKIGMGNARWEDFESSVKAVLQIGAPKESIVLKLQFCNAKSLQKDDLRRKFNSLTQSFDRDCLKIDENDLIEWVKEVLGAGSAGSGDELKCFKKWMSDGKRAVVFIALLQLDTMAPIKVVIKMVKDLN